MDCLTILVIYLPNLISTPSLPYIACAKNITYSRTLVRPQLSTFTSFQQYRTTPYSSKNLYRHADLLYAYTTKI